MNEKKDSSILVFFDYDHLPDHLWKVSKPFGDLAREIDSRPTEHPAEKATALRKLLEAKDAALRAAL